MLLYSPSNPDWVSSSVFWWYLWYILFVHRMSRVWVIFSVSKLYIRYTSVPDWQWYPTIIAFFPLWIILLLCPRLFMMTPISPNVRRFCAYLGCAVPVNFWYADRPSFCVMTLSKSIAVFMASAHRIFRSLPSIPAPINIALTRPYKVANFRSILPFCCGVPADVYSNLMFILFLAHSFSKEIFSPALSHRIRSIVTL